MDLTCAQCGDIFQAGRRDARYCSTRCRVAAHRLRVEGPNIGGRPLTPDTRDPRLGRGVTANDVAERGIEYVAGVTRGNITRFTPEELAAVARPGDLERWVATLEAAADNVRRYARQAARATNPRAQR